jgi:hypothetical protein
MIYESYFWKKELYESYKYIIKFRSLKRIRIESFVKIEKVIMLSAYIVRKLNDAEKIPPAYLEENINISMYNANKEIIDHMNWHHIDENYKLDNKLSKKENWKYILNQIIHSFVFILVYDDNNKLSGIMLNSDKTKGKLVYLINIKDIIKLILKISEGGIVGACNTRDIKIDKDGKKIIGPMKLKWAEYAYPLDFDLNTVVNDSMKGIIYKRNEPPQSKLRGILSDA